MPTRDRSAGPRRRPPGDAPRRSPGRRRRRRRRRAAAGRGSRPDRAIGMKISADARNAIAGRGEREPAVRRLKCQASAAKSSATTVGIVDWKTIAPVMLPIASVSLPWRTQMTELNFSGSSVAIGAMTRASEHLASSPSEVARCSTASTKKNAPSDDQPERDSTWRLTTRSRGTPPGRRRRRPDRGGGTGAARGPRRRRRVGLEVALHVPAVDPDQHDGHDPLRPGRVERQERGARWRCA